MLEPGSDPESYVTKYTTFTKTKACNLRSCNLRRTLLKAQAEADDMKEAGNIKEARALQKVRTPYRGTSIIRNSAPLGPYSRNIPRALWRP